MGDEMGRLRAVLDSQRAGVVKKLAGLSESDARRSTVPSGTNLAGLLQHLTFVESKWIVGIVGGGKVDSRNRSMQVDPAISLRALRLAYRDACLASDAILTAIGDPNALVVHDGKKRDLRWAILAVIEETARHAGHADIIREQIDGKTGR